ncbi:MAG TPA: hypothetical protein VLR49_05335, partial [Ferruginibacter sp.]|nr:hypothetical protein [Ferruginibacter sp.]
MKNKFPRLSIILLGLISLYSSCSKNKSNPVVPPVVVPPITNEVDFWVTKGDKTSLLEKQTAVLGFSTTANSFSNILVDSTVSYQSVDGFGFTLTGGSAELINGMGTTEKNNLLSDLFSANGIGISYLRVSIGASDLSSSVFSYNDLPAGQTDLTLANFSLSQDLTHLVPLLKQILTINPNIKIMGSPWSPPVWMKDNGSSMGGSLKPEYYNVYAQYFVKYIQAMKAQGITIDAVSIQNEPQHGGNNPSMLMTAPQQAAFIKSSLGPAFQAAS